MNRFHFKTDPNQFLLHCRDFIFKVEIREIIMNKQWILL